MLIQILLYLLGRVSYDWVLFLQATEYLKPISLDEHPDYEDFVFKPMDLTKLEKVCTVKP